MIVIKQIVCYIIYLRRDILLPKSEEFDRIVTESSLNGFSYAACCSHVNVGFVRIVS